MEQTPGQVLRKAHDRRQCESISELSEDEAMKLAMEEQRTCRREVFAHDLHERWLRKLSSNLPEGVPLSPHPNYLNDPWPVTFGRYEGEGAIHHEDGSEALQCISCVYYTPLEGELGQDWGACTNPRSQYDRECVFEHWTCKHYSPTYADPHPDDA